MKKKTIIGVMLIVLLIIGGIIGGGMLWLNQNYKEQQTKYQQMSPVINGEIRSELQTLRDAAKRNPVPTGTEIIKICAVGDIMMHSPQYQSAKQADGGYDFNPVFKDIAPYISDADIALGNLETTINTEEKGYYGYPRFRSPKAIIPALKNAGFDILTTANNHSLDNYFFGIGTTNAALKEYDIPHTGSYTSPAQREKILIYEEQGVKFAVLAYTYGTNGMEGAFTAEEIEYAITYTHETDEIIQDIQKAKDLGADIIIACVHWGNEYQRKQSGEQMNVAEKMFGAGVDIIFGSHPHVLQPIDKVESEDGFSDQFVIYSMGNFVSNQRERYKDSGIIVNVDIVKDYDNNAVYVGEVSFVPTWVNKYTENGQLKYKILPVSQYLESLAPNVSKTKMQQVWNDTTTLIGSEQIYR